MSARKIPYLVRGAARFFDRPEVREAVTRIRGAARSGQGEELVELVRSTLAGMGWTSVPPTGRGQTRDRWESWQALVDQAEEFAAGEGKDHDDPAGAFVDDLDRRVAEQHAPVAEGVTLATFHAAKGLEWDHVFLCGLQDGTLPITYADTPAAVEEERRLLYVGMTRARLELSCSWSLARNPGGRGSRKPSRFLDPLLPEEARPKPAGSTRSGRAMTLSRVRHPAAHAGGQEAGPLRGLPGLLRRGAVRAAARVAQGAGRRGQRAGVRRLLRRHPRADRRGEAADPGGAAAHQRHRSTEARRATARTCSRVSGERLRRQKSSGNTDKWFAPDNEGRR